MKNRHIEKDSVVTFQPSGIFPELIGLLSHKLNMSVTYTGKYKSWSSMVQDVSLKKYDIGGTAYAFSLDRSQKVDFSTPVHMTQWKFYYDRTAEAFSEANNWGSYCWPFQFAAWVALIVYACVLTLIIIFNIQSAI